MASHRIHITVSPSIRDQIDELLDDPEVRERFGSISGLVKRSLEFYFTVLREVRKGEEAAEQVGDVLVRRPDGTEVVIVQPGV